LIRLIILLGLVLLVIVVVRGIVRGKSQSGSRQGQWSLLIFVGVLIFVMVATGRLNWLLPVLGAVVAMVVRLLPYLVRYAPLLHRFWQQRKPFQPTSAKEDFSTVNTEYIRMRLNHESGEIDGEILKGRYQGKKLQDLDQTAVLNLLRECRAQDQDAIGLIESYLDRIYGTDWRSREYEGTTNKRTNDKMDEDEARRILGLSIDASNDEIIQQHRKLIQKNHPDRGGSSYLAAKINQAKDILLGNC